ncbi:MAG: hypothetical protein LBL69_06470 [Zoogloeaceae bacterium]|jgi:sensor histidine kinase regulating citrate/malate metabolism|nr:hypothetical protein [Zoogloeaceae bacterium]
MSLLSRRTFLFLWFILIFASAVAFGLVSNLSIQQERKHVDIELRRLAQIAARMIDGQAHQQLTKDSDTGSVEYLRQIEPLLRLHRSAPKLLYVYTVRKNSGNVYFVLDTAKWVRAHRPEITLIHSRVMSRYENPGPAQLAALDMGETTASPVYSDEYGNFKSACAPITDATRQMVGAACIDMDVSDYLKRLRDILRADLIGFLLLVSLITITLPIFARLMRNTQINA